MIHKRLFYIMPFLVGLVVAYVGPWLIDITSGFGIPSNIDNWATESGQTTLVDGLWELFTVQLLGVGILTFATTYLLTAKRFNHWIIIGFLILVSEVLFLEVFLPMFRGDEMGVRYFDGTSVNIWNFSHEFVVLVSALFGAYVGSRH